MLLKSGYNDLTSLNRPKPASKPLGTAKTIDAGIRTNRLHWCQEDIVLSKD